MVVTFADGATVVALTASVGGASEVAGDAALKVDPTSVEAIASGLADLLTDPALRERLGEAGTRRLRDFSWERCARGTAAVLGDAVQAHDL